MNQTPTELCGEFDKTPDTHRLLEFVQEIYSIHFKDEPNYEKLKFILRRAILEAGDIPNNQYDWIKPSRLLRR